MYGHLSPPFSGTLKPGTQTTKPTQAPAPRVPQTGETAWPDQETA